MPFVLGILWAQHDTKQYTEEKGRQAKATAGQAADEAAYGKEQIKQVCACVLCVRVNARVSKLVKKGLRFRVLVR
jgi:hypothetical protein